MDSTHTLAEVSSDRRQLLRVAGLGAAALGGLGLAARATPAAAAAPSVSDVLNFALNLEYLEAEFYLRATTGHGLPGQYTDGSGTKGTVVGGSRVPFTTPRIARIAQDIASDEFAHVKFLRTALAGAAVARPAIDLRTSFTTLARAAGIVGPDGQFDPFASEDNFLVGAYIFEDVGVSAYLGAAGYLTGNATVLSAAAGILAVEAYHGGAIRAQIIRSGTGWNYMADQISRLRAQLSGAQDDVGPLNGHMANVSDSDSNSIAFSRTPDQVLNIVYGGGAASNYLFFPDKLNGAVS